MKQKYTKYKQASSHISFFDINWYFLVTILQKNVTEVHLTVNIIVHNNVQHENKKMGSLYSQFWFHFQNYMYIHFVKNQANYLKV